MPRGQRNTGALKLVDENTNKELVEVSQVVEVVETGLVVGDTEANSVEAIAAAKAAQAAAEQKAAQVPSVSISFRKTYPKRLINSLASANNATLEETEDAFMVSAPFIKVTRSDVEQVTGKITDAKWRMMFVNRSGEVKDFNLYEFTIGTPKAVVADEEATVETVQLNVRIDKEIKAEMEKYRDSNYLDMTQPAFVQEALREFIASIKREVL
jgi:hypothetical protein